MSEATFRMKRRQQFLTEKYFRLNTAAQKYFHDSGIEALAERQGDAKYIASMYRGFYIDKLKLLRLHYTAGEPIEALKPLYADVMHWFAEWHRAEDAYSRYLATKTAEQLRLDMSPMDFEDLFHFQLALDTVSLGVLLGEGQAVRQAAQLMKSERDRGDMLFEAIIEPAVADPKDVGEFFHVEPYDPLLDAVYTADTPEESSAFVKKYLDGWYQAFDGVPWHDGHTRLFEDRSDYEGYWSFEAAAVCVIHGIDDTSFRDHIVYPKDLADWAREHKVLDLVKPKAGAGALALRAEAGQQCPQTGYWFTTAKQGSRKAFKAGEKMPAIKDSHWGATIWYWDEKQ